jgi:hypothetical protein
VPSSEPWRRRRDRALREIDAERPENGSKSSLLQYGNHLDARRLIQPQAGLGGLSGSGIQMSRQRRHT